MGVDYTKPVGPQTGQKETPTANSGDDECTWKTQFYPEGEPYDDDIDRVVEEGQPEDG